MTDLADDGRLPAVLNLDLLWAVESSTMARIVDAMEKLDIDQVVQLPIRRPAPAGRQIGRVAVIDVIGVLSKRSGIVSFLFGGATYEGIRGQIDGALDNPEVDAIVLRIDSPGGAVSGLSELGDAIRSAALQKPVYVQVDGMAASAAFYLASGATAIYANRMDLVGSIGTQLVLYDLSRLYQNAGVKTISIATGEFKGLGTPGLPVTDRQIAFLQGIVDQYYQDFIGAVASGRGLTPETVRAFSDGRVFLAGDAQSMGMIDGVSTLQETLGTIGQALAANRLKAEGDLPMSANGNAPGQAQPAAPVAPDPAPQSATTGSESGPNKTRPATVAELKAACPQSTAEWREAMLESDKTLEEARVSYVALLEQRLRDTSATMASKDTIRPVGELPTKASAGAELTGSASDQIKAMIAERVQAGIPMGQAVKEVLRSNPDLRRQMVQEANPGKTIH
jgi:signal peptide peptidase SppA